MKVFISADIEGTAGIVSWSEAERGHPDYAEFRALMTAEVLAACEGAQAAGASEILIKDAHDSGRNLMLDSLPACASIIRNWSGHPDSMMFGLDSGFHAALCTGYHSKAGTEDNPLAHTSNLRISRLVLNGEVASEFTVNALCAARYKVPMVFIAGDAGICAEARAMVPGIATVETLQGFGAASRSISPAAARIAIAETVEKALSATRLPAPVTLPGQFEVVVEYNNPIDAYRASWYPGAKSHGLRAVAFNSDSFFEIQRALRFMNA